MPIYKIILFSFSVLVLQQCSPTEPPLDEIKNPRTYTWTIDTLSYPGSQYTIMYSIWGSSPGNMYVVGSCSQYEGRIWHFDGEKWAPSPPEISRNNFFYQDIYGFSENDIWMAGFMSSPPYLNSDSCLLMHYNGAKWKAFNLNTKGRLETVGGSLANDIWFGGGTYSRLFHWDGNSVKQDSLPLYIPEDSAYQYVTNKIISKPTGKNYFLVANTYTQTAYIFAHSQAGWSTLYDDIYYYYINDFWIDENENIYKVDASGIYKLTGNTWINIIGWYGASLNAIAATSSNNIFVAGYGVEDGLVYHYNGKDFYLYDNLKLKRLFISMPGLMVQKYSL